MSAENEVYNEQQDIDLLSEEPKTEEVVDDTEADEPAPPTRKVEKGAKADEDEEAESDDEAEEEEEDAPEPDANVPVRVSAKDLKTKYPNIFKAFPTLRGAIFREQQYSSVFPTPASAQAAAQDSQAFGEIRASVIEGDSKDFVNAVKGANGLKQLASTILPALFEADKDAHWDAIAPVFQSLCRSFYNQGQKNGDENVKNSALFLSEFLFSDEKIATGDKSAIDEVARARAEAVREERKSSLSTRQQSFETEVGAEATASLDKIVSSSLAKEKDLTAFVSGAAKVAILKEVANQLNADTLHGSNMRALWNRASKSLAANDKASIIDAYLARARQLVNAAKIKVLSETRGPGHLKPKNGIAPQARREPSSSGRTPGKVATMPNARNIDWSKTSDADILNDTYTVRR